MEFLASGPKKIRKQGQDGNFCLKRYDAALYDTLRALVTVYGDPDPISVKLDDNGALNIEVNSRPGVDPIYDDQLFQ